MEKRYVAGLYKRIELFDNVSAFKLQGIIPNGYINLNDKKFTMSLELDNKKRKILPLTTGFSFDHEYYYDNAITYENLKERYPSIQDENELIYTYLDEIHKDIMLGCYDEETDKLKIVTTTEEILKKCNIEDLSRSFFALTPENYNIINMPVASVISMLELINIKEYDRIEQYLTNVLNGVNLFYKANNIPLIEIKTKEKEKELPKNLDEIYSIIEKSMIELNNMVGIEEIKKEINKFAKLLILKYKTNEFLKLDDINLNMVFTGNPGTGKTTVARILGKLLYNLGYSNKEKIGEVTAKDLIAEYVGQTAIKTAELIEKYKGGVIFIDEAYALSNDANPYANDALVEIIKELERRRTIFIFAGYKDEMRTFIEMNSGISSRIGYNLEYQDYNEQELLEIFMLKASERGFTLEEELKDKLLKVFEQEKQEKHFGNGRYVDNLLDKIILEHSVNTEFESDKEILVKLTIKDLETVNLENNKAKTKKIGFM